MKKKCKACAACSRLYRRLAYGFFPDRLLYCTVREEIVEEEHSCDDWRAKTATVDFSRSRFNEVVADINVLKDILKNS